MLALPVPLVITEAISLNVAFFFQRIFTVSCAANPRREILTVWSRMTLLLGVILIRGLTVKLLDAAHLPYVHFSVCVPIGEAGIFTLSEACA
jgi:hypothetical protein